ncbi:MAG: hypothetical protein IAG13_28580, partial [Deltaproteobacteria bacterium]|nr:hypothetical protein [Nannocystaceae bacterium]
SLDGSVGANLTGYFDAVRGTLAPRAGGTVTLTATLPPRWSIGYIGSVFTAATREPLRIDLEGDLPDGYQIESAILNQVPVRYIIDDNTQIEFGAIVNLRMPHFLADDFTERQTEVWGYFAFRIAGGTARGRREVASRSVGGGQGAATGSGGGGAR